MEKDIKSVDRVGARNLMYKVEQPSKRLEMGEVRKELREVCEKLNPDVVAYEKETRTTYAFLGVDLYMSLEMAYGMGFDDNEACACAKITRRKLKKLKEKYPLLVERIERWKANPVMLAKSVVMDKISEGNVDVAKWWLERRKKEEFSSSTKLEINKRETQRREVAVTIEDIEDIRNRIPIQLAGEDNRGLPMDKAVEVIDLPKETEIPVSEEVRK